MKKILVIDDDRELCDYLHDLLDEMGEYRLIAARTAKAGIKAALRHHPDLVLLDIDLPDMNGMKVLKRLKGNKATYYIPVLMLTGLDVKDLKIQANEDFADGYLVKPFDPGDLEEHIHHVLEHHHGSFAA